MKKSITISLSIIIGTIFVLVSSPIVVYKDFRFLCQNTGSQKGYREWTIGVKTNHWQTISNLEKFITKKHPQELKNYWVSYSGSGYGLSGSPISHGHSSPSNISFRKISDLNFYVDFLNEENKYQLYKDFSTYNKKLADNHFSLYMLLQL